MSSNGETSQQRKYRKDFAAACTDNIDVDNVVIRAMLPVPLGTYLDGVHKCEALRCKNISTCVDTPTQPCARINCPDSQQYCDFNAYPGRYMATLPPNFKTGNPWPAPCILKMLIS